MAEILIADDERVIREGMRSLLVGEGFSVRTARDGEDALRKFAERRPDLLLLDVLMPKLNGFRACEEIRKLDPAVPVIFLTAKDSEADQVRGIGLGADDYVSKAVGESLLLARIRRALQRSAVTAPASVYSPVLRLGAVAVDLDRLTVTDGKSPDRRLTKTESDILRFLAAQDGKPVTPDAIIFALRGNGFACTDNMLYVHLSHLRQKLGSAAGLIVNDRGVGYRLVR